MAPGKTVSGLLASLDRLDRLINAHSSQAMPPAMSQIELAAVAIFSACPSFFRSVAVLIHRRLPGPAYASGRVLFEDSLRLGELSAAGSDRMRVALSWFWEANIRAEALFVHDAVRLGFTDDPSDVRSMVEARRAQILALRVKHGIRRPRPSTVPRNIAHNIGRAREWWDYEYASEYIHGSELASRERLNVQPDGTLAYDPWAASDAALIAAGAFAAQAYILAWRSLADLLVWTEPIELAELEATILAFVDDPADESRPR